MLARDKICGIIYLCPARMAELVDAVDSKSTSSDRVPVQVRIRAPCRNSSIGRATDL